VDIYFVQAGESGPIKIGFSDQDVDGRIATMQTANAETLHLRALIRADISLETDLHSVLGEDRMQGEWFRPSARLLELIDLVNAGDRRGVYEFVHRLR